MDILTHAERAVFRGVYSEIFALFQACVGPISTLYRRGKLLELCLDSS